jgi:DNA-binding CsgD family transcriptional regulator
VTLTTTISGSSPATPVTAIQPGKSAVYEIIRGREAEQKKVRELLRHAHLGHGGVVLLEGEPGIGKSLLLRDAAREAGDHGFTVAGGAEDQLGPAIPFFAWRGDWRHAITELSGADWPDATGPWISQMRGHLEQRTAAAPALVCLDDLQWASPATLAALYALAPDLARHPVAWLLARSNAVHHDAGHLFDRLEKDGAVRLILNPLDADAVWGMLIDAFGAPPDQGLLTLAAGAAGNPAVLAELIVGLCDDNAVRVAGGRAVLVSDRLPRRIHRLARRRLDDLSHRTRHLLVTAAVLGAAFRLEDAAEMLGETPAMLLPEVEEAIGAAIMTASADAFSFQHQLLRRAVNEMTPRPARQALHRQYGEILLARGASAARAAGHLLQAAHPGDPTSLAGLDTAAAQTLDSDPQSAADLAGRALELTPPASADALVRAVVAAEALTAAGRLDQAAGIVQDMLARPQPPEADARLRCALSAVLCARGQVRGAADQAQLVLAQPWLPPGLKDVALSAQLQALVGLDNEQAGLIAASVLAAPNRHARHVAAAACLTRAVICWEQGQIRDGLELWRDGARHSAGISSDARHMQPLLALAAALIDLREISEAEGALPSGNLQALQRIPAQAALTLVRARIHLARGQLDDALAAAQSALAASLALGAHGYTATARCVLSVIELRRGNIAAAAEHLAGRAAPGPHIAEIYARPETTLAQVQITEAHDGPASAISYVRQLCADLRARPGLLLGDPTTPAWMVRTALAAGEDELAARVARTAQDLNDANPGFPALATAAAHSQGLFDQDRARLAQAAGQHTDPWAKASAAEDLGILQLRDGHHQHAIYHLKEALAGYRQVGANRDQARIRRRLRKLGFRRRHWTTPTARPVTGWDSLTGTEQAIARVVAQGLNNSQVAARMYISTHTVAHHLRQTFRKLDISSRVELTRIVIQQTVDRS